MRRIPLLLAALIVIPVVVHAQWEQLPGPTGGPVQQFVELSDGRILAAQQFGSCYVFDADHLSWVHVWSPPALRYPFFLQTWSIHSTTHIVRAASGTLLALKGTTITRSTDDGRSWQTVLPDTTIPWLINLARISTSPDGAVFLTQRSTLYVSVDDGRTWREVTAIDDMLVMTIGLRDSVWLTGGAEALYRSTDGGANWEALLMPPTPGLDMDMHTVDDSLLFLYPGTRQTYLSTNNGDTWLQCMGVRDPFREISRLNADRLIARTDSALYYSRDDGRRWDVVPSVEQMTPFASIATQDEEILLSVDHELAVLRSTDAGMSWSVAQEGMLRPRLTALLVDDRGQIFCGSDAGGLYRSMDDGSTWQLMRTAPYSRHPVERLRRMRSGRIYALGIDWARSSDRGGSWEEYDQQWEDVLEVDSLLFAAQFLGQVLTSTDHGNTWNARKHWIPTDSSQGEMYDVVLHLVPDATHRILLAATDQGMRRSTDQGQTWEFSFFDGTLPRILDVGVVSEHFIAACTPERLWRSRDAGASWTPVYHSPDSGLAPTVTYNRKGDLFIADRNRIMISRDGGNSWSAMEFLPDDSQVMRLATDSSGHLYVGTAYHGILRSVETTLDVVRPAIAPEQLRITGIHPHPLHTDGSMHIRFDGARDGVIRLRLYDVMGRLRQDAEVPVTGAGTQRYELPLRGLRSGTYFLWMSGEGQSAARKVLIY